MTTLDTNVVLLFASHLEEAVSSSNANGNAPAWKTNTLTICCEDKPETAAFLKPLLDTTTNSTVSEDDSPPRLAISPAPILQWLEQRLSSSSSSTKENLALESRMRCNAMRDIVARLATKGGVEVFDSRVRVALKQTARDLGLDWHTDIAPTENLLFANRAEQEKAVVAANGITSGAPAAASSSQWNPLRVAQVLTAGVVGGTVIGLTGGAAAPVIAPVFASLFAVTTTAAVSAGIISGVFGVMGAGLASYKMSARTDRTLTEFAFIDCSTASPTANVNVVIGISGYFPPSALPLSSSSTAAANPNLDAYLAQYWRRATTTTLDDDLSLEGRYGGSQVFAVKFEPQAIANYSYTLTEMLKSQAISYTGGELLKFVLGATVMLPISLMQNLDLISNSFAVCVTKAYAAGTELALALQSRYQGYRPVTLCGFGFGALAVFHCLERLAELGVEGVVENVVLAGCPLRARHSRWLAARSVVAGRIVNCYCAADWSLQVAMRATISVGAAIAGVQPVLDVPGVFNVSCDTPHSKFASVDGGGAECMRGLIKSNVY